MKTMNSSRLETDLALYIQVEVEAASAIELYFKRIDCSYVWSKTHDKDVYDIKICDSYYATIHKNTKWYKEIACRFI